MKISYNWLKEYINTDLSPNKISELLTDTGLEVEGVEEIETIKGGLKGIVIGKVVSCEPHPNADRLKKTQVDIGGEELLSIVCGAPNVAEGQKVAVATVGAVIYSDEGDFKIKKSKIRGELSQGMICAEGELNLGESHDGIMVLKEDTPIGIPASEYFKVESDFVFEIGLTPNRTDAMSHYGVARDLRAALIRYNHKNIQLNLASVSSFKVDHNNLPITIKVEDAEACPRYAGLSLSGVEVKASPDWLQNKLRAIGVGPINNIVDVTNFVLHETGHPLHAFDADEIIGNTVIVKTLEQGTTFTTLDDKERSLDHKDLMICNAEEPMVLAGVFGGKKSGVSHKTTKIFIESAVFNPVSVRKSAKRHALNTDASFRYERGVDPEMTLYALKRAATLIQEIAGGEISMNIQDVYPAAIKPFEVSLSLDRMATLIGQEIETDMVYSILDSLDIKILSVQDRILHLSVPAYRADVQREADVIEEVLRIYGFNAIAFDHKMKISVAQTDAKSEARYREKISNHLTANGFSEIMNNSLTKGAYYENWGFSSENSVSMLNPLSQDLSALRQSLLFGGLEVIAYNSNRQRPDLKIYEFGKTYKKQDDYQENFVLSLWISGHEKPENWNQPTSKSDFYTLKSKIESIFNTLGINGIVEEEVQSDILDFGLNLSLHKNNVATLGKVSTPLCKALDIKQEVYYAEIQWDYLCKKASKNTIKFTDIPKYQEVRRDLALLVDKSVNYAALKTSAQKAERKLLRNINLFDVYEGKNLPKNKKSYAMSFILRDDNGTLNDTQVDKSMEKILKALEKDFEVSLR